MSTRPGSSSSEMSESPGGEPDHSRSFGFQGENIYKKKRVRTNNCHVERRFISDCHKYHKDTSYAATKSFRRIRVKFTFDFLHETAA